jgi:epoxyqueuosine reductase
MDYLSDVPGSVADELKPGHAYIARYARGRDYHKVLRLRLQKLCERIEAEVGAFGYRVFTDSAPVLEVELAARSGIGWRGKHTLALDRQAGSMFFLGEIYVDLALPPTPPVEPHCGICTACIDVCPTRAIVGPYRLDARRCISYLTIEHRGPIPRELRPLMGNRIYGCDDCLAVCPWNKFAQAGREAKLHARETLRAPKLGELARLDDAAFRALFSKSPVKRTGRDRFVRNVLIAIGNSGDVALAAEAERLLGDPSPLVRGAAVWALARLDPARFAQLSDTHRSGERDAEVLKEWIAA